MVGAGIRTLLGNIFGEEINQSSSKTPNIHCLAGLEHSHLCCHNSHFPTLIQQLYITRRKVIVVKITAFQESGGNARSKVLWCCEESSVLFFWLPLPSSLLLFIFAASYYVKLLCYFQMTECIGGVCFFT